MRVPSASQERLAPHATSRKADRGKGNRWTKNRQSARSAIAPNSIKDLRDTGDVADTPLSDLWGLAENLSRSDES